MRKVPFIRLASEKRGLSSPSRLDSFLPVLMKLESPLSKPRASMAVPPRLRVSPLLVGVKDSLSSLRSTVTFPLPKASSSSLCSAFMNFSFMLPMGSVGLIPALSMMSPISKILVVPL